MLARFMMVETDSYSYGNGNDNRIVLYRNMAKDGGEEQAPVRLLFVILTSPSPFPFLFPALLTSKSKPNWK